MKLANSTSILSDELTTNFNITDSQEDPQPSTSMYKKRYRQSKRACEIIRSILPLQYIFKYFLPNFYISRLKSRTMAMKLTGGLRKEQILSPYSAIYLKPYIRRDVETYPPWLRLMNEIQLVVNRTNSDYVLLPRAPIDYTYVQPEHIPAINSICNHFFWPGIDSHCRLKHHMHRIGLVEDTQCRLRLEDDETADHILCACPAVERIRFSMFGRARLLPEDLDSKSHPIRLSVTESLQYPDFSCVALYKKLIVGFAFLVPDVKHTESYLSFVFTRPSWRNCGIAKFMIYHLVQTSLGKDITLHVSINNPALFLYQKFGFKVENVVLDFYDKYFRSDVVDETCIFLQIGKIIS
ncbi:hypothetical protein NQ317_007381 [Molorchus minor]|uniref:N-acetyltransferase domain-containing protein n=1 Tax=Molorchus minor TaxID=1323400 RepID=A0ABQ9IRI0_9CUCU|nr:hypothetical protein NQ317_007381 [Molorchus minor]